MMFNGDNMFTFIASATLKYAMWRNCGIAWDLMQLVNGMVSLVAGLSYLCQIESVATVVRTLISCWVGHLTAEL
jgi:hypothetical protein